MQALCRNITRFASKDVSIMNVLYVCMYVCIMYISRVTCNHDIKFIIFY